MMKIEREVRIWAKLRHSQYIVQYIMSWIENYNDRNVDFDPMASNKSDKSSCLLSSSTPIPKPKPLSGPILHIQMELCRMTLKVAIVKINTELEQSYDKPMTTVGKYIASQLFSEILNGVYHMHSLSPPIIHRDLKPGNVFITDGRGGNFIKIGDFGLAVLHGDEDDDTLKEIKINDIEHTAGRGTDGYMAPEVYHSKNYNEKCDIYSLGMIMRDLFCVKKNLKILDP